MTKVTILVDRTQLTDPSWPRLQMSTGARRALLVAMIALVPMSCSEKQAAPATKRNCSLPTPGRDVKSDVVADAFLLGGDAEVAITESRRDRLIATLNVSRDVQGALTGYRSAVKNAGYTVLQEDNEGFEAELYLQRSEEVAVLQIRSSACEDKVLVLINLPAE